MKKKYAPWFFVILGLILALVPFIGSYGINGELHLLGDYTGGVVGSCWALAGTIFIYQSLIQQQEESQKQIIAITEQNFSSIFFNMLNVYRDIMINTENQFNDDDDEREGFQIVLDDINRNKNGYEDLSMGKRRQLEAPLLFIQEIYDSINSHINLLESLSYHIDRSKDPTNLQVQHTTYFRIIRASMTSSQLSLIKLALEKEKHMMVDEIKIFLD